MHRPRRYRYPVALPIRSITGNTIPALMKNGESVRRVIGGFVKVSDIIGLKMLKLLEVIVIYEDECGVRVHLSIKNKHYTVGVLCNNTYCVALFNGPPLYPVLHRNIKKMCLRSTCSIVTY